MSLRSRRKVRASAVVNMPSDTGSLSFLDLCVDLIVQGMDDRFKRSFEHLFRATGAVLSGQGALPEHIAQFNGFRNREIRSEKNHDGESVIDVLAITK